MPKFRQKSVVIEAMHVPAYTWLLPPMYVRDDGHRIGGEVYDWITEHGGTVTLHHEENGRAFGLIETLEGPMRLEIGDWVIRGIKGEFYPIKNSIFQETYEPADEATS